MRRQIAIQVVDIESIEDYYLYRIDAAVDFSFIRARVAHLYSYTGRPSINPEIAFRLVTLSYLLGISENRLFHGIAPSCRLSLILRPGLQQSSS